MRSYNVTCLCIAVILLTCGVAAYASTPEIDRSQAYQDFRDIPGVTAEEITAIEALQAKYAKFTYGMMFTTEAFERADGAVGGYSALFTQWMSTLFGIEFELQIYLWEDLLLGFEAGDIDFTGELTATRERRDKYYMSDTFTERAIKAFRIAGSAELGEIAKTRALRYIFLEGTTTAEAVASASEYPVEIIFVPSEEAAIGALLAGEADAFMAEAHGAASAPDFMVCEDIFPVVYSPISFSTAKEELAPIVSVLDKYLKNGAFLQLIELYNQGNREYEQYKFLSGLTDAEKEYLAAHQAGGTAVPVMIEFDAYPISFYNKQEAAWQGIAVDVLDGISALSGLKFEYANAADETWASLYERFERGEAAMITELIRYAGREDSFLWSDVPYSKDYYALLSLTELPDISINEILFSRVGTIANSAYEDVFRSWFPDHQALIGYPASNEAFIALQRGEIDLFMASKNLLLSAVIYNETPGFKVNMVFDRSFGSTFGFNKGEEALCGIVGKAQAFLDTQMITERWASKSFDYRSKMANQQVFYLVIVSLILVCSMVIFFVLFMRNRNMNKRLEITVRERTAQFENAAQAKGNFLSHMSHEIRTPLNAIIGMALIAKRSAGAEAPKTLDSIDKMLTASDHLLGILNDVLDMSKIEAGKFSLYQDHFEVLAALKEVESIIRQRCDEKGIYFETVYQGFADIAIIGDQLRLKQVLINLLGNAVKFTEPGGKVSLAVRLMGIREEKVLLSFTVQDNGIGMSAEQTARLFSAFEQTSGEVATKYGGTGLGLAISQNLVMMMGGEIAVESKPNEGSKFSFEVAFDQAVCPAMAGSKQDVGPLDLDGKRILLVEDVEINRAIIIDLLAETRAWFTEAVNGAEAVRLFKESDVGFFDLILMDIQMPEMDGYEAASLIRSLDRADAQAVPIVAMTANAYKEDVESALKAGMDAHLAKPIDFDKLIALLYGTLCKPS